MDISIRSMMILLILTIGIFGSGCVADGNDIDFELEKGYDMMVSGEQTFYVLHDGYPYTYPEGTEKYEICMEEFDVNWMGCTYSSSGEIKLGEDGKRQVLGRHTNEISTILNKTQGMTILETALLIDKLCDVKTDQMTKCKQILYDKHL